MLLHSDSSAVSMNSGLESSTKRKFLNVSEHGDDDEKTALVSEQNSAISAAQLRHKLRLKSV